MHTSARFRYKWQVVCGCMRPAQVQTTRLLKPHQHRVSIKAAAFSETMIVAEDRENLRFPCSFPQFLPVLRDESITYGKQKV